MEVRSDSILEKKARTIANFYHSVVTTHRRKYTNEPYILHLAAVAETVRSVPHTEEMLCAAWLHDTVEDTPCTLDEIENLFGAKIASLVEALTDVSKPEDGNRKARKALDRAHTAKASPEAQTIKLADLIDNTSSIVQHDPDFAKVYMKEKELLLEVLKDGDPTLYAKAKSYIDKYKEAQQL